ncbi:MAG: hypothetical protein AAFY42_12100, partial [Pseudomonadota bacterium]
MLGDTRFYHREALTAIRRLGSDAPRLFIVEQGLLRPNTILVDNSGMGGRSLIPERFEAERASAGPCFEPPDFKPNFLRYAAFDVGYHTANVLARPMYPSYIPPSSLDQMREYTGWLRKAATRPLRKRTDRRARQIFDGKPGPKVLFPLQLETDAQLLEFG